MGVWEGPLFGSLYLKTYLIIYTVQFFRPFYFYVTGGLLLVARLPPVDKEVSGDADGLLPVTLLPSAPGIGGITAVGSATNCGTAPVLGLLLATGP